MIVVSPHVIRAVPAASESERAHRDRKKKGEASLYGEHSPHRRGVDALTDALAGETIDDVINACVADATGRNGRAIAGTVHAASGLRLASGVSRTAVGRDPGLGAGRRSDRRAHPRGDG
jgi:hypothetical protein